MTLEVINWYNLRKNKCPKCAKDFTIGLSVVGKVLFHKKCGFRISEEKFKVITTSQNEKALNVTGEE